MTLSAATRLGPYEIVSPLGAGGMGEVYRAKDTRLGREVAIKVLPAHLIENAEVRSRFEREARTISSLNHPHICTLHDVGREGDTDYLVMELVDGETLAQKLTRGPLPNNEILKLATQIADALDRAHRAGIVHRDFKPGNVMVTRSGAKLMDFGLARTGVTSGAAPGSTSGGVTIAQLTQSPTMVSPLTQQGSLIGTFLYMAPEQLDGKEVDTRSDIWAFGCVLYEMATGRRAFEGKTQASLIGAIMNSEPPPIAASGSTASPALEALIRACLAKDPEERIQTAHDIKLQLSWISQSGSVTGATPVELPKRRRSHETIAWAVAGLAVAALAFVAWRSMKPTTFGSEQVRFNVPVPNNVDNVDLPRISPDGRLIAFTGHDNSGRTMLWVRPLRSLAANPLPGTEGCGRAFWSPDSRYLAYFTNGKLWKIPALGGPPQQICDAPNGFDGSWGKSGVILYDGSASADPIRRVNASGGIATEAMPFDSLLGVGWPAFLPDGQHYIYTLLDVNQPTLMVGKLGEPKGKPLGLAGSRVEYSVDGHLLYVRNQTLLAQRFNSRTLKTTGEPFPIADSLPTGGNAQANFSVSTNGVLLYRAVGALTSRIEWRDHNGREISRVSTPQQYRAPSLSPDGTRLAIRRTEANAAAADIWTIDLARGISTRLTFDPGVDANPLWSRDGSKIVWSAVRNGITSLRIKSASGLGNEEILVRTAVGAVWAEDFSPDGRFLLYGTSQGSRAQIHVRGMSEDTTSRMLFESSFFSGQSRFSPDGRRIVYASNESGRPEIYVGNFEGPPAKWQVSTEGGIDPRWAPNGRELFYIAPNQKMMSVPIGAGPDFVPGTPVEVMPARYDALPRNSYCISPDGQRFLFLIPESDQNWPMTVVVNWQASGERR